MMAVTISELKPYSVRLFLELFVGESMSYLRYLCLFVHSGVQLILCCVFALIFFFCELSFFDCPFGILERLFVLLGHLSSHPAFMGFVLINRLLCFFVFLFW